MDAKGVADADLEGLVFPHERHGKVPGMPFRRSLKISPVGGGSEGPQKEKMRTLERLYAKGGNGRTEVRSGGLPSMPRSSPFFVQRLWGWRWKRHGLAGKIGFWPGRVSC